MRSLPISLCILLNLATPCASAMDGAVDPAFGTNGQVVIERPQQTPGNSSQPTGDLVVLADGRFIWAAPLDDGSVWVGRGWRNGTPDTTFGTDGTGRITLPSCGLKRNVRLVSDGANGIYLWSDGCLRHVLGDGSTQADFGGGAMPTQGFLGADLAQDSTGRFVLGGREGQLGTVYRFNSEGIADTTFGNAGRVVVSLPANSWNEVNALLVRPDGRILLAGSRGNTHGANLVVAQLLANGSADTTWNGDGFIDMDPPATYNGTVAHGLALDTDGSLVVSGFGSNGSSSCCILVTRFDSSGQIDLEFGVRLYRLSGQPTIYPFFEQRDGPVLLPNHRILVGAISFPFVAPFGHRTQFTLLRTFSNGSLDPQFGHDGWNSYTIADPGNLGQSGDYNQMHALRYDGADSSMLILGRTFFEDNSTGKDYVSLVRARFDLIFDSPFD